MEVFGIDGHANSAILLSEAKLQKLIDSHDVI